MNTPVIRGLKRLGRLTEEDMRLLGGSIGQSVRRIEAGRSLIQKGEKPTSAFLILEGWAYRYKTLSNGRRQIIAFLIPGDISDLNIFGLPRMDHSIASLTPLAFAELPRESFEEFFNGTQPRIARALWIKFLVGASIQREWTVNLGQRSAPERLGHLFCELFYRLKAVGLTEGNHCHLPLTQSDLAESTGLSLVHVNKRLQDLRNAGLIVLRGKVLLIPDIEALETASIFNPDYLVVHDEPGLESSP
jgi:CRP-like cAMP-binding protein